MAKYLCKVGYGLSEEIRPGVYENIIRERRYYGDVKKDVAKWREGERVHPHFTASNQISIVADPYAFEHYFAIRYVEWMGTLWSISEILVQRPRLILRLGGVYNGPTPTSAADAGGNSGG